MCGQNHPLGADPTGDSLVAKCCELRPGFGHLRRLFPQSTTEVLSQHWRKYLLEYPVPPSPDLSDPSAHYQGMLEPMLAIAAGVGEEELALIRELYKKHYPALLGAGGLYKKRGPAHLVGAEVDATVIVTRLRKLCARVVGWPLPKHV